MYSKRKRPTCTIKTNIIQRTGRASGRISLSKRIHTVCFSMYDEPIKGWKEEYDLIFLKHLQFLEETDSHIPAAKCDATMLVVEERKNKSRCRCQNKKICWKKHGFM